MTEASGKATNLRPGTPAFLLDQAITGILKTIRELMNPPVQQKRPIGFIELKEKK